ncbi:MAG: ABC transporter ATP-binding protein [Desulfobacterales bacterium]|nr:ABC transporter ATP-binding protein [Desulfobacterales bacterium]
MTSAIAVENLGHAFDGRTVLAELSFAVPAGCFFTIIGPNGSGKTTLLKLLVGLLRPQAGGIAVLERAIGDYPARQLARTIAYVPQSVPATFAFSVQQVVLMGRAPHLGLLGLEGAADLELAREAMRLADVAQLANRRLDQLSGGEQQRVFIARAICQQPKILLLDEPTASLDLAHQVAVMDLMERLKRDQGITIVMVSHDLNLAAMYADRLLLLDRGRLAGLGPPREVLDFNLLERVYGCTLLVDKSPLGEYSRVHLVPGRYLISRSS